MVLLLSSKRGYIDLFLDHLDGNEARVNAFGNARAFSGAGFY